MIDTDHTLKTLFWEATSRCNAGCEFCGSSCTNAAPDDVDGDTVYRAFEHIAAAYPAQSIMVNVTGGEPLTRMDLFEVMDRVRRLGFEWGMVTNGSLITDKAIARMRDTGMSTISISVDGLYEAHERTRRLPGSFDRIVGAIKKLAEAAFLDHIQITTVVTKENLHSLDEMFDFFATLPLDSWRIGIVDDIGRCEEQRQLLLDAQDLRELQRFADRHIFDERLLITTSCSHYLGNADTLYRQHPFHCDTGRRVASILADGSIYVCPNVPRIKELIQGNIKTDDFVDVWENGFRWFRDDTSRKVGKCADCVAWDKCRADCMHTWDFKSQKPKFCWLEVADVKQRDYTLPETVALKSKEYVDHLSGCKISYGSSSLKTVFFLPDACEKLFCEFRWGRKHPLNLFEQMVAMIGFAESDHAYVVDLVTVPLCDRSDNTAYFYEELHQYALGETAIFNRNLPECPDILCDQDGKVTLLGYLHSHPMELKTKMSQPDIGMQRQMQQRLSVKALTGILNPQNKDLCIYWDSVYSPVDVVLLCDASAAQKWQ